MKISPLLTFNILYRHRLFFSVILYWNYVPFIAYLVGFAGQVFFSQSQIINLILSIVVAVLLILFQLYQWSYGFFIAQNVSEGMVGIASYDLRDLFSDWGVKTKLTIIKLIYFSPVAILAVVLFGFSVEQVSALTPSYSSAIVFANYYAYGVVLTALFFAIDHTLITAANYQYSYTNSLIQAFNLVAVMKFVRSNFVDLMGIGLIQLGFYLLCFTALGLLMFLLQVPLLGSILMAILLGFYTSWNTLYIPTLNGQVWGSYYRKEVGRK